MKKSVIFNIITLFLCISISPSKIYAGHASNSNSSYEQNYHNALKHLGRIYYNARQGKYQKYNTTIYCNCTLVYDGKKPKHVDTELCGFHYRKSKIKGSKIEWEHLMPVSYFAQQFDCWNEGGRKACGKNPGYRYMEGDMHNLAPAIGEVNMDRSNFPFKLTDQRPYQYGNCPMLINFKKGYAMPPQRARGIIARAYLYMAKRYAFKLSSSDLKQFRQWDKDYPPNAWECERNRLIAKIQGNDNQFITTHCNISANE